ncbi:hypothetical protein BSU01_04940 [Erwinia billingiae]|nr:hypothetical protein [Erwinia billingiae]
MLLLSPLLRHGNYLNKLTNLLLTFRELLTGPLQRGHYLRLCGQFRLWFLCVFSPDKNLYHCFGCDSGGSVLDWLLHTERLRFP